MNTACVSDETNETEKPSMLDGLKKLIGPRKPPEAAPTPAQTRGETIMRLRALIEERERVSNLVYEENKRARELSEQLQQEESDRVEAIAKARLNRVPLDSKQSESMEANHATLRRGIAEATAVAARMKTRLDELTTEVQALKLEYDKALGEFLDQLYAEAMARYNALAPNLAGAVLQVSAVRRVMMGRMLGNTNGWNGDILLPGMEPKQGRTIPPILDGSSAQFSKNHALNIEDRIRLAGFIYGKDFFKSKG